MATYIKFKCDGGCGSNPCCNGMFKELNDADIPIMTGVTASIRGGTHQGVDLSVSISSLSQTPARGATGALDIVIRPDRMTLGQDIVQFSLFGSLCGTGYSGFNPAAIKVAITHPASVSISGTAECERDDGNGGYEQYIISYSGLPPCDPCEASGGYFWDDRGHTLTAQGSATSIMFLSAGEYLDRVTPQRMLIINETSQELAAAWPPDNTALEGVFLKKLNTDGTEQTYPAYQSNFGKPYGVPKLSPGVGTSLWKRFTGFSSAPGNYKLTWPLLKAPYRFTIPAP